MRQGLVVVSALVASLGLGLVSASAAVTGDSQDLPTVILVPVGKLGDEGRYDRFESNRALDQLEYGNTWSFRVNGTRQTLDEVGLQRETVVLDWAGFRGDVVPYRTLVDVATRDAIQTDFWAPVDSAYPTVYIDYGPHFDQTFMRWLIQDCVFWVVSPCAGYNLGARADLILARFQGKELTLGEDLTNDTRETFLRAWGIGKGGLEFSDFSARAVAVALIDGEAAVEVRVDGNASFAIPGTDVYDTDGTQPFLSFRVPEGTTFQFRQSAWFSSTKAYPVRIEDEVQMTGGLRRSAVSILHQVATGSVPIPWRPASEALPYSDANPDLERSSPRSLYPSDGANPVFPFMISDAVDAVDSNPGLPAFNAWRAIHPQNVVYGANFEGSTWQLLFAEPSGETFEVRAQFVSDTGFVAVSEDPIRTAIRVPPFSTGERPTGLVTLAAIHRLLVDAGLGRWENGYGGMSWRYREDIPATVNAELSFPGRPQNTAVQNVTFLIVNPETGWLLGAKDIAPSGFSAYGPPEATILGPPPAAAPPAPSAPAARALFVGGLVSTSAFAVFLLAYFSPLLRYLVAGFAKLRPPDVLNNKAREELMRLIREEPGVGASEVGRRLRSSTGAGWSTVVYHLRVLEKNRLVSSLIDGRHRRFFPVGEIRWQDRAVLAVLKNDKSKQLYEALRARPGLIRRELAATIGTTEPGVTWHLRRLLRSGLIERRVDGRSPRYFPTNQAAS
jgi:predicted transcriptional regulator